MTGIHETVKSVIRIEKETYDLYRLLDVTKLDDKARNTLKRFAADASRHLKMLEEKYWDTEPSLATYVQHFIPEIEFATDKLDESSLLKSIIDNRKALSSLYSNLSRMNIDPELCDMFRKMAEKTGPVSTL